MPAPVIVERFDSKEISESKDNPSVDLIYMIMNTEDYATANGLMASTIPAKFGDLFLDDYHIVHQGNGVWEGTARYVKWKSESQYSFDTGGGTQHVTQSIANVGKYSASGFTAPDFFGAIGVTDDRVEGTDVTVQPLRDSPRGKFCSSEQAARNVAWTIGRSHSDLRQAQTSLVYRSGASQESPKKAGSTFGFALSMTRTRLPRR